MQVQLTRTVEVVKATKRKKPSMPARAKAPPPPVAKKTPPSPEEEAERQRLHLERTRREIREAAARRRARNEKIVASFRAQWPALFGEGALIRPLARGLHKQLIASLPQFKPHHVRKALAAFLTYGGMRADYLDVIAEGGPRYDLHGQPYGEVTPEEQEQARQELKMMRRKA